MPYRTRDPVRLCWSRTARTPAHRPHPVTWPRNSRNRASTSPCTLSVSRSIQLPVYSSAASPTPPAVPTATPTTPPSSPRHCPSRWTTPSPATRRGAAHRRCRPAIAAGTAAGPRSVRRYLRGGRNRLRQCRWHNEVLHEAGPGRRPDVCLGDDHPVGYRRGLAGWLIARRRRSANGPPDIHR